MSAERYEGVDVDQLLTHKSIGRELSEWNLKWNCSSLVVLWAEHLTFQWGRASEFLKLVFGGFLRTGLLYGFSMESPQTPQVKKKKRG